MTDTNIKGLPEGKYFTEIGYSDRDWVELRMLKDASYRVVRYKADKPIAEVNTDGYDDAMTHFRALCKAAREDRA